MKSNQPLRSMATRFTAIFFLISIFFALLLLPLPRRSSSVSRARDRGEEKGGGVAKRRGKG